MFIFTWTGTSKPERVLRPRSREGIEVGHWQVRSQEDFLGALFLSASFIKCSISKCCSDAEENALRSGRIAELIHLHRRLNKLVPGPLQRWRRWEFRSGTSSTQWSFTNFAKVTDVSQKLSICHFYITLANDVELHFFRLLNDQITNGTVVRVRMVNFMSCVDTEMRPGPGFNVVIGPNGTGTCGHYHSW